MFLDSVNSNIVHRSNKQYEGSAEGCGTFATGAPGLLAEFESPLPGGLKAAKLGPRRLSDEEPFVETELALNPLNPDRRVSIGFSWQH
jgi:hypothetical protein